MKDSTLTDIAKRLSLSPSTVSRALTDHPDISRETKLRVKELASELNYSPNPIAQSLKNKRSKTIGVLVPEIKHDFFSSALSGIEEVAYHAGYSIILTQSNESLEREIINTNVLISHRVAGIIASISQQTTNGNHFKELNDRKIPFVFFDRVFNGISANKVVIDDEKSAYNAVIHLIEKGYKKIAHFGGPKELAICEKRLNGYKSALQSAGISINENLILFGGMHETDGYSSMSSLLEKNIIPDSVFCVNDPVAIGAYQKIKEAGIKIPDEIGLVGFSNNKITALVDPQITTVEQPSFNMGRKSAELLLEIIERRDNEPVRTITLDTNLIVRDSTNKK